MPNDTLGQDAQAAIRSAETFMRSEPKNQSDLHYHITTLKTIAGRLEDDIEERGGLYIEDLQRSERQELDALDNRMNENSQYVRTLAKQQANQQTFDDLRQVNGGAYPRNISPVIYILPLLLVGLAEWYVNFETFAAIFIPVFAIAGTLIVAAVFAWASHMHGSYLKQLSEITHPSVEYRNELGRKLAVTLATLLIIGAFITIVVLRYIVITDQLGLGTGATNSVFGRASTSMIWSRVGPTVAINIFIWGLGTLYAWALSEKVPGIRESYRDLLRSNKKLDRLRKPYDADKQRTSAKYKRDREKNQVALRENQRHLDDLKSILKRFTENRESVG